MTFQGIAVLMTGVILLTLGVIAVSVVRGVLRLRRNSMAPERTVEAVVTAKRTQTHTPAGGPRQRSTHATACYVSFRTAGGETVELAVPGEVYARLREGDRGSLTAQGERFCGFL